MDSRDFFNSAAALKLGLWLGRTIPPRVGYQLAAGATSLLARRHASPMYRTVQSNMQVVLGPEASPATLDRVVRGVYRHVGQVYYDFYRLYGRGQRALVDAVDISPRLLEVFDELQAQGRGVVVVGAHMSNFDLATLAMAYRGLKITALAFASPTSGYDMQNQIRQEAGIDWLPIDVSLLRRALSILRSGGIIVTGVDRPDPYGGGEMLPFFGRPARLPVGHVRLALQTDVPVGIIAVEYRPSTRRYRLHLVAMLEMERAGSRSESVMHNARRVLGVAERIIAAHPDQWLMFYPVWEEALAATQPGPPHSSV